jgi:hypothetical protein
MYDTGIADRLRAAGLNVVEVAGWQTRGSASFGILGSLDHHTAGSRTGNAPSLTICIYGRSDLPGPLCQVLMGRDNTCYVIAAGRANHAGAGNWRGLTSNGQLSGLERENVGTTAEPWREDQTDAAARAHAALIRGRAGADMVARHAEYALPVGRKVDSHSVSGADLRRRVGDYLTKGGGTVPKPPVQTPSVEDMMPFPVIACDRDDYTGDLARFWTALLPGKIIRFAAWNPGLPEIGSNPEAREVWAPNWVYDGGVAGGVFKPVERITKDGRGNTVSGAGSVLMFDRACAAAAQFCVLVTVGQGDGADDMRLQAIQNLVESEARAEGRLPADV